MTGKNYRLVIDTNTYAGSFEREIIAFITGQVGDCEIGYEYAEQAHEELPASILGFWSDHVLHLPDHDEDDAYLRPAVLYPTQGFFNNGYGENYPDTEQGIAQALASFKSSSLRANNECLEILDLAKSPANSRSRAIIEDELIKLEAKTSIHKYTAYMSVAVVLDVAPPSEILASFICRAMKFAKQYRDLSGNPFDLKITDVSVVEEITDTQAATLCEPFSIYSRTSVLNQSVK